MSDIEEVDGDLELPEAGIGIFNTLEQQKAFTSWIDNRLDIAVNDRAERMNKWQEWRDLRTNTPEVSVKKRPYPVSARMTIPITEINVNGIAGKIRKSMMVDPPWTVESLKLGEDLAEENAEIINKYLTILAKSPHDLNYKILQNEIIYEAVSMGTEFVKIPWKQDTRVYRKSAADSEGNEEFSIKESGPEIIPIALEDFIYELEGGLDIDRLTWCAHRFYLTKTELLNLKFNEIYENVDEILDYGADSSVKDSLERQETNLGYSESDPNLYEFLEIWAYWDIDGIGRPYDIVVTYAPDAQIVVKADYNNLGLRPFVNVTYGVYPGFVEGRGVCEMLRDLAKSVNSLNRMRFDNININTTALFATTKGSGISQKEQIYPGKIFFLDDVRNLQRVPGGSPYNSTITEEQMLVQYAQKVSGFSDAMGGFADSTAKSGDSFSAQSQRIQMGEGQLSSASESMELAFSKIGMVIFFQLVTHRTEVIKNERIIGRLSDSDIDKLDNALDLDVDNLTRKLTFTVSTTDLEQTFASKRQTLLMTTQLLNTYYDRLIQYKMMLADPNIQQNPEMQELITKACVASSKMMEDIIKLNEISNADSYVYNTKMQEQQLKIQDFMKKLLVENREKDFNEARANAENQLQQAGEGSGIPGPVESGGEEIGNIRGPERVVNDEGLGAPGEGVEEPGIGQ